MLLGLILSSFLTFVQFNCENLFDCQQDTLKNDVEFLPESARRWTKWRYWRKLDAVGKAILSCGESNGDYLLPDIVALCEVENDTVMRDLTRRSLLRGARYEYVMTDSRDERGIDVALMYSIFAFAPLRHYSLRVPPTEGHGPMRDILYVHGITAKRDTLHLFVLHAPSRHGGKRATQPHRMAMAKRLCEAIDSVNATCDSAKIVVMGDFNAYCDEPSMQLIYSHGMHNATQDARGSHGAKATYRYKGQWRSLDHILLSAPLMSRRRSSRINDATFLLEEDTTYGGVKPRRTYNGYRYQQGGTSDHLPIVVEINVE